MRRGEWVHGGHFDDGFRLALEEHGQDHDIDRRRLAQAGADGSVTAGDILHEDALFLVRALADEAFAERDAIRQLSLIHI